MKIVMERRREGGREGEKVELVMERSREGSKVKIVMERRR